MMHLILVLGIVAGGFEHPMLYVLDLTGKIDPSAYKSVLPNAKIVFNGHALRWYAPDTLVLLTERHLVVQLPAGSDSQDYRSFASFVARKFGIQRDIKVDSGRFTSKFGYTYLDENGQPALGVVVTARGGRRRSHQRLLDFKKIGLKSLPRSKSASDTTVVILYKTDISDWAAIDWLHEIYADHYVDLNYTTKISERLSELQSIRPEHVIVVADAGDLDPNFMYDADTTVRAIDGDEFQDATLSFITGFDADDAETLAVAPDASDSKTIVIANPDGSLRGSGYSGVWVTNFLYDDDNYLGDERLYVNTTSSDDADATAENIADEFNNLSRQNVIFLDHGYFRNWTLRGWSGGRAHDGVCGFYSDLRTWKDSDGNGYLDQYFVVNNEEAAFIYAGGCLTSRINGARETNWGPWESVSSNVAGILTQSITLAWLEDSPGCYIGSHSVSYGEPFLKLLLLNMARGNCTPAEALRIGKDTYNFIIGDETTDDDPSDGETDDFLEYLRHEFVSFGKPTWETQMSTGTSPDYMVWLDDLTQVDQHPDITRGYVYAGEPVKYTTTAHIEFFEEIAHEPWGSATEDSMPFTYIFVKDVGGNGSSVWASSQCAVIAGEIEPGKTSGYPEDADSIEFASGDPSDAYKLYEHWYYGAGNPEAIEIFKARESHPDRIFWLVAAGITDADNDGYIEWRINNGYSKYFDVNIYMPPVEVEVLDTSDLGFNNWSQTIIVSNPASVTPHEVIVRLGVQGGTTSADSVRPDSLVHDLVLVDDNGSKFIEFTLDSLLGESKAPETLVVYYYGEPSDVDESSDSPSVPKTLNFHVKPSLSHDKFDLTIELPSTSPATIRIYDASGRTVKRFDLGVLSAGVHRVAWNGTDEVGHTVGSGVYFVELDVGTKRLLRKAILMRTKR